MPVNNGYTVSVGCQTFAFTSDAELIAALSRYLNDPETAHKEFGVTAPAPLPPGEFGGIGLPGAPTTATEFTGARERR